MDALYENTKDEETATLKRSTDHSSEAHYEFDASSEENYWEPSSKEDELKAQFHKLGIEEISENSIK